MESKKWTRLYARNCARRRLRYAVDTQNSVALQRLGWDVRPIDWVGNEHKPKVLVMHKDFRDPAHITDIMKILKTFHSKIARDIFWNREVELYYLRHKGKEIYVTFEIGVKDSKIPVNWK